MVASDSFDIFGDDDEDLPATSRLGETVKEDNAGAQNGGLAELPGYVYDESSGYEDPCITLENLALPNLLVCVMCPYDSTGVRGNTLCIGFWRNVIWKAKLHMQPFVGNYNGLYFIFNIVTSLFAIGTTTVPLMATILIRIRGFSAMPNLDNGK